MALPLLTDHPLKGHSATKPELRCGKLRCGIDDRLMVDQPAEGDNADKPQDTEEDGDPVQVSLDDRGGAEGRGHPAAEQVR
jgi:hypothetical protein